MPALATPEPTNNTNKDYTVGPIFTAFIEMGFTSMFSFLVQHIYGSVPSVWPVEKVSASHFHRNWFIVYLVSIVEFATSSEQMHSKGLATPDCISGFFSKPACVGIGFLPAFSLQVPR